VRLLLVLLTLVCTTAVRASVTMMGTRVVYPGRMKEQTLQFQNPDTHPNVVQIWLDDGTQGTPETSQSPFLALPQIFRIEPQTGQMVRLVFTGDDKLSQDRESVFYLNFSQLPVQRQADAGVNQLLLMFTSRLKVFYRPAGIAASPPADMAQQLRLAWRDGALHVHNPTAYHVVVARAELLTGAEPVSLMTADMIAPFSNVIWRAPEKISVQGKPLRLVLINDYGAEVVTQLNAP